MNFPDVSKAKSAINNIFPIMDRPSSIDPCSPEGLIPVDPVKGQLEVKDVCFHYPTRPSVEVLRWVPAACLGLVSRLQRKHTCYTMPQPMGFNMCSSGGGKHTACSLTSLHSTLDLSFLSRGIAGLV